MNKNLKEGALKKLDFLSEYIQKKINESDDMEQLDQFFNVDVFRVEEMKEFIKVSDTFTTLHAKEANALFTKYKLGNSDIAEYIELLKAGKKIHAIKEYRSKSGVGLKEAKDFIDALQKKHNITYNV